MTIGIWPAIDHGILSPSGRVSKRARAAAHERERVRLFGPNGLAKPDLSAQPSERETLLRQAAELREMAARGLSPRKFTKRAAELDQLAAKASGR